MFGARKSRLRAHSVFRVPRRVFFANDTNPLFSMRIAVAVLVPYLIPEEREGN